MLSTSSTCYFTTLISICESPCLLDIILESSLNIIFFYCFISWQSIFPFLLFCISRGFLLSASHCVRKNIRDWGKRYLHLAWGSNILHCRDGGDEVKQEIELNVFIPLSSCTFSTWHTLLLPSALKCDLRYQGVSVLSQLSTVFCMYHRGASFHTFLSPPSQWMVVTLLRAKLTAAVFSVLLVQILCLASSMHVGLVGEAFAVSFLFSQWLPGSTLYLWWILCRRAFPGLSW